MKFIKGKLYQVVKNVYNSRCVGCVIEYGGGNRPKRAVINNFCKKKFSPCGIFASYPMSERILKPYVPLTSYLKELREKYKGYKK